MPAITDTVSVFAIFVQSTGDVCQKQARLAEAQKSGLLQVHRYSDFMQKWLRGCITCCQAKRVRYFLEEFTVYIDTMSSTSGETYMDDKQIRKLVIDAALASPEQLQAALAVFTHFQSAWSELVDQFARRLEKQLRSQLDSEWVIDRDGFSGNWTGIYAGKKAWGDTHSVTTVRLQVE